MTTPTSVSLRSSVGFTADLTLGALGLFLALIVEEYFASGRYTADPRVAPALYGLGRELWERSDGVSTISLLVIVGALTSLVRRRVGRIRAPHASVVLTAIVLLVFVTRPFRDAWLGILPFAITASAYQITIALHSALAHRFEYFALRFLALVNLATIFKALIALSVGGGQTDRFVPFYDGIGIVIAGASILAFAYAPKGATLWQFVVAGAAFTLAASAGSRRTMLSGLVLAAVLMVLLGLRRNLSGALRLALLTSFGVIALLWTGRSSNLSQGLDAIISDAGDSSSTQHLSDLTVGMQLCRTQAGLWNGLGTQQHQLAGLASSSGSTLYIHSEYLQTCATSGYFQLAAVLIVIGLLFALAARAVLLVNKPAAPISGFASAVGLLTPVVMFWFPYFSTSQRWPVLIGVAIAIITAYCPSDHKIHGSLKVLQ